MCRRFVEALGVVGFLSLLGTGSAETLTLDVRGAGLKPVRTGVESWGGTSPREGTLRANNYYFELNGKPFPLVAGEFHPQRYPAEFWEEAILELKAAGLNTISSYIFWSQVEPRPGQFDFTGRNDVRRFAALCRKHGMRWFPRIGPFNNSEFLLGGLPPWLYGMPTVERSNDPLYLKLVGRYYAALGGQLKEALWKNGGPVIAVQLENELSHAPNQWDTLFHIAASVEGHRGPKGDAFTQHYIHLYDLAKQGGLDVPFYSVTAWGCEGPLPIDRVFPTYGGYMYLAPPGPKDGNSGLTAFGPHDREHRGKVPIGYSELGTGSPARTNFRPMPPDESYLATALTRLGSLESLMVGYYMFHGGSNPYDPTFGWTPKSTAFPAISYDFWAPIGEYGQWRSSLRLLRPFNLFVQQFGAELGPMECRQPASPVTQPADDKLRCIARANGSSAFLFLCNYGNIHPLSPRTNVQFTVSTDSGDVRLPARGTIDLPSAAFGILPVHLALGGGLDLVSATAQPLCRVTQKGETWLFLAELPGVRCELVLNRTGTAEPEPPSDEKALRIFDIVPSRNRAVRLTAPDGTVVNLVVLPAADARNLAWFPGSHGDRLVITEREATWDGRAFKVSGRGEPVFDVSVFPALSAPPAAKHLTVTSAADGVFTRLRATVPARTIAATLDRTGDDKLVLKVPAAAWEGLNDIYADVTYAGDLCRVFNIATGLLVADQMNNGQPWQLGLKRFRKELAADGLWLRVEPTFAGAHAVATGDGMLLDVKQRAVGTAPSVTEIVLRPEYQVSFPLP